MKAFLFTLTLAAVAVPAMGEVTLYGREAFQGRSVTFRDQVRNLEREGFANRASSAVVRRGSYELCDDRGFAGNCVVLGPGRYPTLAAMGMNDAVVSLRPAAVAPAGAEITLFGREDFGGRSFATREPVRNLERLNFADRASSAIVQGGRFEICDGRGFEGRCMVLRPGRYPSLAAMGMNDAITSVRPLTRQARIEERRFAPAPPAVIEERRFAGPPPVAYDYRRRGEERLFEADVVAVRAVYGQAEQRCWVERESAPASEANVGGAIAGALIGGILGHQVGSGRGNDAATAAGAVAGAAIGSNYGGTTYSRDVQRCSRERVSGPPQYWDVTYRFRGVDRFVQMTRPPGRTITVNADGEPRAAG